jgi:hypothetical protein
MVNPDRNLYEPPYDDALLYDTDLEPERPRSRPLVVLLGIVVLAAFAGVVWVAYNQGIKQGQSGLPVLTADAGPTRIVPDAATSSPAIDPAPEKSYDRLMSAEPEGDQVNMLPKAEQPRTTPSPQDLATAPAPATADETGTGGKFGVKRTDFDAPGFAEPGMDSTVANINGKSEDITSALPTTATPPAKPIAPPPAPLAPVKPATSTQIAAAPAAPAPIAPKAEAPKAELAPAETAPAATESKPVSGPAIQLGSFPNAGDAAQAWSKIKSTNQALLADVTPTFARAEIPGKGTWFRLRVSGFADKAAAQSVCQQLQASGQACIIAAK